MSNIEHLIENAIVLQQAVIDGKHGSEWAWRAFSEDEANMHMAASCELSLRTAWGIGFYVADNWLRGG